MPLAGTRSESRGHADTRVFAGGPEVWFYILESNFKAARIVAHSIKYADVMSSLGSHYIAEIRDIILNPPEERVRFNKIRPDQAPEFTARAQDALVTRAGRDRRPQTIAILTSPQPRRQRGL